MNCSCSAADSHATSFTGTAASIHSISRPAPCRSAPPEHSLTLCLVQGSFSCWEPAFFSLIPKPLSHSWPPRWASFPSHARREPQRHGLSPVGLTYGAYTSSNFHYVNSLPNAGLGPLSNLPLFFGRSEPLFLGLALRALVLHSAYFLLTPSHNHPDFHAHIDIHVYTYSIPLVLRVCMHSRLHNPLPLLLTELKACSSGGLHRWRPPRLTRLASVLEILHLLASQTRPTLLG